MIVDYRSKYTLLTTLARLGLIENLEFRTFWDPQTGGDEGSQYDIVIINRSIYEA